MGRLYAVSFTEVAVTAAVDMFEIRPADDKAVEVVGLFIAQSSDFGDAQAENIPYRVIRGFTTSGSGGAAPTPVPMDPNTAAAGFTAETNNTAAATTGTTVDLHASTFNIAVGEALWLPEGAGWKATQTNTSLVVRLASLPLDSIDFSGTLYVKEL
jgi:hypothetical protein